MVCLKHLQGRLRETNKRTSVRRDLIRLTCSGLLLITRDSQLSLPVTQSEMRPSRTDDPRTAKSHQRSRERNAVMRCDTNIVNANCQYSR